MLRDPLPPNSVHRLVLFFGRRGRGRNLQHGAYAAGQKGRCMGAIFKWRGIQDKLPLPTSDAAEILFTFMWLDATLEESTWLRGLTQPCSSGRFSVPLDSQWAFLSE